MMKKPKLGSLICDEYVLQRWVVFKWFSDKDVYGTIVNIESCYLEIFWFVSGKSCSVKWPNEDFSIIS